MPLVVTPRLPHRGIAVLAALLAAGGAAAVPFTPLTAAAVPSGPASGSASDAARPKADVEFRNYMLGARTSQSSVEAAAVPERAQDGDTDGASTETVAHTLHESSPWWQGDLGQPRPLTRIVVWPQTPATDSEGASSQVYVFTSPIPFRSTNPEQTKAQPGVSTVVVGRASETPVTVALTGATRYVRVQLPGEGQLSLAEVQAFGQKSLPDPAANAKRWVDNHPFGMFLHYGMGTMVNQQWADPTTPPTRFAPSADVDPTQWASGMQSAGMNFGVLTAKHHDGFALWPTRYSDYSIASSGYQGGKGDIVRDYARAQRSAGLDVGIYFSIWDRHNGNPPSLIRNQLRELLTQYGPIDYLWFDGWGWQIPYNEVPYQQLRDFIRNVSPGTVVANNDHHGSLDTTDVVVWEVPVQGFPPADDIRPKDASDTLDGQSTWFHTSSTGAPKLARQIVTSLQQLNAGHSLYLLNVGPQEDGTIPQAYRDRLGEIGTMRETGVPPQLAYGKPATQSSTYTDFGNVLAAGKAVDGQWGTMSHTLQQAQPWWQVDLGVAHQLTSVELYNRSDCCAARDTDFWLFVSSTPFDTTLTPEQQAQSPGVWSQRHTGQMGVPTTIQTPVSGRYIMVQLAGSNYLALTEVNVFGNP